MKKVWSVLSTILVALVVLLAIGLVTARLMGIQFFTILSGSMEPEYHVGSLIFVKNTDPKTLKVGDVITFMVSENAIATHRITQIIPDDTDPSVLRFRTKGDANAQADGTLVHMNNVIGTPIYAVPGAGYAVDYIQRPPGIYIAAIIIAAIVIVTFMPTPQAKEEPKKETEE